MFQPQNSRDLHFSSSTTVKNMKTGVQYKCALLSVSEKTCNRIEIENAVIRGDKQQYRIDEIATYDCSEGYEGNPVRVCRNFGWSGESRCEGKE